MAAGRFLYTLSASYKTLVVAGYVNASSWGATELGACGIDAVNCKWRDTDLRFFFF